MGVFFGIGATILCLPYTIFFFEEEEEKENLDLFLNFLRVLMITKFCLNWNKKKKLYKKTPFFSKGQTNLWPMASVGARRRSVFTKKVFVIYLITMQILTKH